MEVLGKQMLIEYSDCDATIIANVDKVEFAVLSALRASRATVISQQFHQFQPYGVSGIVMIAESHVAIHSWPEYNYAAVDIFTCGNSIQPKIIRDHLQHSLGARHISSQKIERGLREK
jgi:S-adenosylmethionine decarboxylase proenzyme